MSDEVSRSEPEDLDFVQPGYLGPTPPLSQLPPRGERLWVDRPEQLLHAVSLLKKATVVAVDAEFAQTRSHAHKDGATHTPRLALLQLAIDQHCFVVDALRLHDLSLLANVLAQPSIAVLLHGAGADLRVMAERGLHVAHYYDLEASCRSIFGQHESSLAAMLRRAFGIHLDKSLQRTDWTRRPLPPAMIAYAARDAEGTLALYHWLVQYYHAILQLHEHTTNQSEPVAPWIEPFLRGNTPYSAEVAVAEAKARGIIADKAQIITDCQEALVLVTHPMRRGRLLRLITDLSLSQLTEDILPLLQGPTSDERAGSARALGRLNVKSAEEPIRLLLQDPVHDVRKAAQTALRNLTAKAPRHQQAIPSKAADGTRRWIVESANQPVAEDEGWKARLRTMLDA